MYSGGAYQYYHACSDKNTTIATDVNHNYINWIIWALQTQSLRFVLLTNIIPII